MQLIPEVVLRDNKKKRKVVSNFPLCSLYYWGSLDAAAGGVACDVEITFSCNSVFKKKTHHKGIKGASSWRWTLLTFMKCIEYPAESAAFKGWNCPDTPVNRLIFPQISWKKPLLLQMPGNVKHQVKWSGRRWQWLKPAGALRPNSGYYDVTKKEKNIILTSILDGIQLNEASQRRWDSRKWAVRDGRFVWFFLPPSPYTHSDVVNSHPHSPVVIDLLCGDRFSLVGQKYAQQQQQALVAVNHAYRKWGRKQEMKKSNQVTGGVSERAAPPFAYSKQYTTVCVQSCLHAPSHQILMSWINYC